MESSHWNHSLASEQDADGARSSPAANIWQGGCTRCPPLNLLVEAATFRARREATVQRQQRVLPRSCTVCAASASSLRFNACRRCTTHPCVLAHCRFGLKRKFEMAFPLSRSEKSRVEKLGKCKTRGWGFLYSLEYQPNPARKEVPGGDNFLFARTCEAGKSNKSALFLFKVTPPPNVWVIEKTFFATRGGVKALGH